MSGNIFLQSAKFSTLEQAGKVNITVTRTGDLSAPVEIEYGITTISAEPGTDFVYPTGKILLQPGADQATITIDIIDDNIAEATESFAISLINVSSGNLLFPRTAHVDILDNETPRVDPVDPPLSSAYTVVQKDLLTGLDFPLGLKFAPHNPNQAYVVEKGGVVKSFDLATSETSVFFDLSSKVNNTADRGLMDVAFHPSFPDVPYVYAFYVVDPPESAGQVGNDGPDGGGNRYAQLVRLTADASTGYKTIVPGSEVVLLGGAGKSLSNISGNGAVDSTSDVNQPESGYDPTSNTYVDDYIKVDSLSHAGGALAFGPDGALYVATGDGTSYNLADPRSASVQSIHSLSGKILRIDPITGKGLADNPFVASANSLDSNAAKVYQLGLRNPFSMTVAPDGEVILTNTGWFSWEEIEKGGAGANFGWPYYEGGPNGVLMKAPGYQELPEAAAFYAAVERGDIKITAAFNAFSHYPSDPGYTVQAITGGTVIYKGGVYPEELKNDFFFTNITAGDVYTVDVNDRQALQYLFKANGFIVSFAEGPDGYVYYANLFGSIGRLEITRAIDGNVIYGTDAGEKINGTAGKDIITALGGDDRVYGNAGDDLFKAVIGDGSDRYDGGRGSDTVDYSSLIDGITVTLGNVGRVSTPDGSRDQLVSIENVIGTQAGDSITGDRSANILDGGAGNDVISGRGGNDRIQGGFGDDRLHGGDGNDTVEGGTGNDVLTGGKGRDVFVFQPGFGNDIVTDFDANPKGGQDILDLRSFGITDLTFADRINLVDLGNDVQVVVDQTDSITLQKVKNVASITSQDFWLA